MHLFVNWVGGRGLSSHARHLVHMKQIKSSLAHDFNVALVWYPSPAWNAHLSYPGRKVACSRCLLHSSNLNDDPVNYPLDTPLAQ